ncbi:DEAD/DEAH box helicase [Kitasatospora purpeofusca]|uniref:DEAD/DEAH box helicase n=1 Tax=Kitasatospora purpeofusca TaxID=67352 RepID=UPI002259E530|nr:DEAD/DEAH box helicase [Kitasatospora purpeofusca]MCX4755091.1 Helicase associated domain protein [Kitasatospora purpeofusca]WSR29488.1 Helicase associated domain protein [Kitasatospora purpeofusca]WSR37011.1 Helicase associated domain protein [Kitasatospora purpeofusca]
MQTTTATAEQDVPAALRAQAVPPVPAQQPSGTTAVNPLPLHWFQKDAVAAAVKAVKNGGRATIVAATGSGKTLIAAGCARRLAARGRVLVLVPTIELLEQTAEAWSLKGGRRGLAVAACSRAEALESAEAGGRVHAQVTTQAPRIADLVTKLKAGEPVTVYATYASLERIVKAHKDFGLPVWDVVVIDEAHRTAGSEGKAWAAIHSDEKVPALRRLYFTATPKIADDTRAKAGLADLTTDADGQGAEQLPALCSMTDTRIYGETVYTWTLGQGIEHGYLADYRVLVPVVTDEDLRELLNLPAVADLRSQRSNEELLRLALQIAVLRAVADLELRRVITFHSRVTAAREFATTMNATAELLPDRDRPERVTALAVAGSDKLKDRRAAFATFSASTGERPGEEGEECCIICNSRLLNEGIDVEAVDAIVFADPKNSVIDVVQAVGRALRQAYRQGKVSWVIIPVYLPTPLVGDDTQAADPAKVTEAGEAVKAEADEEIEASSFRTIWRVLRALAAHDARVVGRITELRTKRVGEKGDVTEPETGEESGEAADGEQPDPQSPVEWLRINARKHAAQILQTVKLRTFNPRATEWQRMYQLAAAFHTSHHHLDPTDKTRDGALISWLDRQRYLSGAGLLAPVRIHELDQLGMIWDKHARSWDRGYAHARAWAATHSHLAIPAAEKLDGHAVGAWMGRQRKNTKLTAVQDAKLTALDAMWRIEPDWTRSYRRLLAYLATGGTLDGPANRTGGEADPTFRPGAWLRKQDKARAEEKLTVQQTALLDALPDALAEQPEQGPAERTVTWTAEWTCRACGDGGDAQFEDGTSVDADHDCDQDDDGAIDWEGRAECTCGWALETQFANGDYVEADHHCVTDR